MYNFWNDTDDLDFTDNVSIVEMGVFFNQYIMFFIKICFVEVLKRRNKKKTKSAKDSVNQ